MLPWMCGRQTLTIVVSSPCITHAQMIVAVVRPRLATGGALSPLTACTLALIAAQRRLGEPADPPRATRATAAMKPGLGLSSPRKSFYTGNHRRLSRDYPEHRRVRGANLTFGTWPAA